MTAGPPGAGMFAGMDPALAAEAQKMWQQLEDMSASDPAAYKKFIAEQMQSGAAEGIVPPTPDMPVPGRRVRVHSLVKMAEYNGREGVVKSVLDGGRLCVLLDAGKEVVPSPKKELSLKASNLEVLGAASAAVPRGFSAGNSSGQGAGKAEPLAEVKVKPTEGEDEGIKELALPSSVPAKRSGGRPLIQEVSESINPELPEAVHTQKVSETAEGSRNLVITVECPQAATVGEIDLQVTDTEIMLNAEGQRPLQLPLQHTVKSDALTAKFNKKKRLLTLTIPLAEPPVP